ncbi:MAG: DUF2330 domain-containing protein [Planctomycetota bacterium]
MNDLRYKIVLTLVVSCAMLSWLQADPCGMVPPIYTGPSSITRTGLQKTYVFHKDGVESFVIRPGFQGKVDNFGMLIPFPNPPEIRKVADNVFDQVANAVDPPEVVVDLRVRRRMMRGGGVANAPMAVADKKLEFRQTVNVLKEEAVGMYEVAVLEAGSAEALKKWMDKNGYKYPAGMDKVTNDYVDDGWCFVAVKTKVGQKEGVDPKPGARNVKRELPDNSVFDGNVQGMGFRFKSEELVVPMRLSAFNDGDLRNVVYLLTDGPRKIRSIPEEYVVRQLSGTEVIENVTQPLPLRIIGGTEKDIPEFQRRGLPGLRNPVPKNGVAKDLFASDLLAVDSGDLSLRHEEEEKELLRIGEYFGLRGAEIDRENSDALSELRDETTKKGLDLLKGMTLTVVDGDFPREVIANNNLTFASYNMPAARNNQLNYDATRFAPGIRREGILKTGSIDWKAVDRQVASSQRGFRLGLFSLVGVGMIGMIGVFFYQRPKTVLLVVLVIGLFAGSAFAGETGSLQQNDDAALIAKLENSKSATEAIEGLRKAAMENETRRDKIIKDLLKVVKSDENIAKRGWAIAAMAEIGGQDVDEYLLNVHADEKQKKVVRTYAAAARVSMTRTVNGLIEKANLIPQFPALGRPIGMRIVEKMSADDADVEPEKVLSVSIKVPQLNAALAPMIMAFGADKLTDVMIHAEDQNVRRTAAGYLAAMAQQGEKDAVSQAVIESLKYEPGAMSVPWEGGPLFVPGLQWKKEDATQLVAGLVRWHLWSDINGKQDELRQIHNNIRSLALAKAAGYQSPGWREANVQAWLKAWGSVVGKEGVQKILNEQGVADNPKYAGVLNEL